MANKYFTELATFQQAAASKKGFNLRVLYMDGNEEISTTFPVEQIADIIDIVDDLEGVASDFIYIWNSRSQEVAAINKRFVRKIVITFC